MWLSFRVQILPTNPQLSETSSEILRFVISIRYHLSETLWIFFTLSPHETMTFQQVPWFLDFISYFLFFSNIRAQACGQVSWSTCFKYSVFSQIRHQFWSTLLQNEFARADKNPFLFAAKNRCFQGRVHHPPLKNNFQGWVTPSPAPRNHFQNTKKSSPTGF